MQCSIKRQDYLTLHYIVEQAYKKFKKQQRINKQPAFNIIRILNTFKQIFPTTPDRIYKLIMIITKKYNPQTLTQWQQAIQKINQQQINKSYSTFNIHNMSNLNNLTQLNNISNFNNLSNLNQSSIQQVQHKIQSSRQQKIKNNQNSIKTYKQQLDNQIDYIQSKRSRLKFVNDFRVTQPSWMAQNTLDQNKQNVMQFSNKNSLRNSNFLRNDPQFRSSQQLRTSQHAHLISFQPTHKDSIKQNADKIRSIIKQGNFSQQRNYNKQQNLNHTQKYSLPQKYSIQKKINPYHEITKIDNLSLIEDQSSKDQSKTLYSNNYRTQQNSRRIIPSKTTRDYSIVRASTGFDSKDSKTQNQKSHLILEYQDFNMTLSQWESLNQRTNTFYQFNLKLKSFSALLANYQAFQSDRFLKNKADVFHACYLGSKAIIAFKNNIQIQQIHKQNLSKAEEFHNTSLNKKTWKLLKVLKDLKIKNNKNKFQLQKLNRINYEFMINFMFEQKQLSESSPRKLQTHKADQNYDFERKAQYFSKTQNFDNVWNIYKCFGLNINISKDQLAKFYSNYHKCLQSTIFKLLKKNIQNNRDKYLKKHESRLLEKCFAILISRKNVSKQLKNKQVKAEQYYIKKLKQKSCKILLSIVYSTKIFSKRQEYIQSKKIDKTKRDILKKWIQQYKAIILRRKIQTQRISILYQAVNKLIMEVSYRLIRQQSKQVENKIIQCNKRWQEKMMRKVLKHMNLLITKKKKYLNICENNQIQFKRRILQKWSKLIKVKQSLRIIQESYKKLVYRRLFIPLYKSIVKKYLISQQQEKNILKQCFDIIKANRQQMINKRNQNMNNTVEYLQNNYKMQLIRSLRINNMETKRNNKQQEINNKLQLLNQYLNNCNKYKFYNSIKSIKSLKEQQCNKIKLIHLTVKYNSSLLLIKNTTQQSNLKSNINQLQLYLKRQSLSTFHSLSKRQIYQNKQIQLKFKVNKKLLSNFTSIVSSKNNYFIQLNQKAYQHFASLFQRKVLLSLANNYIDVSQKTRLLQQTLSIKRKQQYFNIFTFKTNKQSQIKIKSQKIAKRQLFSSLRQNYSLKNKQKSLKQLIKQNKIQQTLDSFMEQIQRNNKQKLMSKLSDKLKRKIFWIRFNEYFIDSLFEKKHQFMAYKFRALKLYELTFNIWKQQIKGDSNLKQLIRNKRGKQNKKQTSINNQTQKYSHMYRPTDSSQNYVVNLARTIQ